MSTDHGFRCRDCNELSVIDNARSCMVPDLNLVLGHLNAVAEVKNVVGLMVSFDGCYSGGDDAIQFAIPHRSRGHTVVVADEYGRDWDQCSGYDVCSGCDVRHPCSLTVDHEGPHQRGKR